MVSCRHLQIIIALQHMTLHWLKFTVTRAGLQKLIVCNWMQTCLDSQALLKAFKGATEWQTAQHVLCLLTWACACKRDWHTAFTTSWAPGTLYANPCMIVHGFTLAMCYNSNWPRHSFLFEQAWTASMGPTDMNISSVNSYSQNLLPICKTIRERKYHVHFVHTKTLSLQ